MSDALRNAAQAALEAWRSVCGLHGWDPSHIAHFDRLRDALAEQETMTVDDLRERLTGRAPIKMERIRKAAELRPTLEPWPVRAVDEPEVPAETPQSEPPLEWALWHDGDLLIRRGEASVVLTADERASIGEWLAKVAA